MTAASSMGHASMAAARQAFALYARAPLASTGWIVLAIGGLIATSNALFGQQHVHPSPFFYQPRSEIVQPVPESVIPAPAPQVRPSTRPAVQELPAAVPATPQPIMAPATTNTGEKVTNQMLADAQRKLQQLGLFTGDVDGFYGPKTAEAIRAFEIQAGLPPKGALDLSVISTILRTSGAELTRPQSVNVAQPVSQPSAVTNIVSPSGEAALAALVSAQPPAQSPQTVVTTTDPQPTASVTPLAETPANETIVPQTTGPIDVTDPDYVRKVQEGLASLAFLQGRIDGIAGESTARAIRNFEVFYNYQVTGRVTPELLDLLIEQGAAID
ncbi:MAG: peptidoglycan-binding protein [Hyphomicrobiaceae bacterium]|nr:peptidoglycan-binding protein [Hyphomicrobiaceae bacterium]MCC0023160.1 peptidoglycan-binding protein [Hyphomicrobiaceae bacterium]